MNALPERLLHAVLDHMPVARLALHGLEGAPEALPIVFARAANALWSPVDGKPKGTPERLGRLARLARAPQVMLLIDHYAEDWDELWWLRVRACASVVSGEHDDWTAAVTALALKYPQYRSVPMFKGTPTLLRFAPEHLAWWASGGRAGLERWLDGRA